MLRVGSLTAVTRSACETRPFDYVIAFWAGSRQTCPVFLSSTDSPRTLVVPAEVEATDAEKLAALPVCRSGEIGL